MNSANENRPELKPGLFWYSMLLFFIIFAFYGTLSQNLGFIFDDREQILAESSQIETADLLQIFSSPHFSNLLYYRPLSRLFLKFQMVIFGKVPYGFRLVNCLLISLCAVLLFWLFSEQFTRLSRRICFLAALCVALHPVTSSCVYMISGQESLLALLFILLSVNSFRQGWTLLACVSFYAALLSRENAAVFPVMLTVTALISAHGQENCQQFQRRNLLFLWAILAGYFIQRGLIFDKNAFGEGFQTWEKPFFAGLYLLQTILTPSLALEYEPLEALWMSYEKSLTALVVCICLAYRYRVNSNSRDMIKYWLIWLIFMFAPAANIIMQQTEYDERHCLIALPALFGLVLSGGHDYIMRSRKKALFAFCLIAAIFAGITQNRAQYFTNDFNFASQWLKVNPGAGEALAIMGSLFWEKGDSKMALELFKTALRYRPNMASTYDNIGCLLSNSGQIEDAAEFFKHAVALDPQNYNYRYNLAINFLARRMYIESYINLSLVKSRGTGLPAKVGKLADLSIAQTLIGFFFNKTN